MSWNNYEFADITFSDMIQTDKNTHTSVKIKSLKS